MATKGGPIRGQDLVAVRGTCRPKDGQNLAQFPDPVPQHLRLTGCHCPGGGWIMGAAVSESFGCAEEGLSYRGSLVEHRSSGACAAEQSGIEHGAEVAAYGAERHAGR